MHKSQNKRLLSNLVLMIDIRLKGKLGLYKTDDKYRDDVGWRLPIASIVVAIY